MTRCNADTSARPLCWCLIPVKDTQCFNESDLTVRHTVLIWSSASKVQFVQQLCGLTQRSGVCAGEILTAEPVLQLGVPLWLQRALGELHHQQRTLHIQPVQQPVVPRLQPPPASSTSSFIDARLLQPPSISSSTS